MIDSLIECAVTLRKTHAKLAARRGRYIKWGRLDILFRFSASYKYATRLSKPNWQQICEMAFFRSVIFYPEFRQGSFKS